MKLEREFLRGVGPLATLRALQSGERYGYELVELLTQRSGGILEMGQSTLYPMLYSLEAKGLVASRLDESGPRPRKYYRITEKGERRLAADLQQWEGLVKGMSALLAGPDSAAEGGVA